LRSILDSIADHPGVTLETTEKIRGFIKRKFVKKGELLQREGDLNNDIYFICNGLLRSYVIDSKGKEHTIMFAQEGMLFSNIDTAAKKSPSLVYIDALEDSEIEVFNKDVIFQLSFLPTAILLDAINMVLLQLSSVQNKLILLMSANVSERYEYFRKTYPHLVQRVPQKMIASYLNITPHLLSKLRSQKRKAE
jgi:CRP-like cAMP-binding protein